MAPDRPIVVNPLAVRGCGSEWMSAHNSEVDILLHTEAWIPDQFIIERRATNKDVGPYKHYKKWD